MNSAQTHWKALKRASQWKKKLETLNVDCTIAVGLTYENAKRQNARIETLFKWVLRVCLDTAYFAENWKHCNKIIFKYVNSIVRPIFN